MNEWTLQIMESWIPMPDLNFIKDFIFYKSNKDRNLDVSTLRNVTCLMR